MLYPILDGRGKSEKLPMHCEHFIPNPAISGQIEVVPTWHKNTEEHQASFPSSLKFTTCDAIQENVHKVAKLVFPIAMEIGRGDCKEHLKENQVNWCIVSRVMTF